MFSVMDAFLMCHWSASALKVKKENWDGGFCYRDKVTFTVELQLWIKKLEPP